MIDDNFCKCKDCAKSVTVTVSGACKKIKENIEFIGKHLYVPVLL